MYRVFVELLSYQMNYAQQTSAHLSYKVAGVPITLAKVSHAQNPRGRER